MNKDVLLLILDGWGISSDPSVSAIDLAHTPFIDSLYKQFAHATLRTDGENVGLPEGQMGNSEVGHTNLGAGRIVYQDLERINNTIADKTLFKNDTLTKAFNYAKTQNKPIHFLGLLSDGGVHSHINHLFGLLNVAKQYGLKQLFVHAFTDGRDVDPKSGINHLKHLTDFLKTNPAQLATLTGRYYAMDRDKRWERIKIAYDALVHSQGEKSADVSAALKASYANGITDEFIKPIIATDIKGLPVSKIQNGDVVLFFNFRNDRGRQLTEALSQKAFPNQKMTPLNLHFVTMTTYDETFSNIKVLFKKDNLKDTLGAVLAKNNKSQLRIAETEKYPHVTFFFSGGQEIQFKGEERLLKNSPNVATYDLKPEMSAFELTEALCPLIKNKTYNFICFNLANGDMVGHTGNLEAAIKACEAVDVCVKQVITAALKANYSTLLTADHGNCELMKNPDGSPNTAHTTNPVPIITIDPDIKHIKNGILGNIAPTVLDIMGIEKPAIMTQNSLI